MHRYNNRMSLSEIYARIAERLEVVGLSARAASQAAGLSGDAIRNIERGTESGRTKGASTHTITALAPVLKVSAGWLLTGEGARTMFEVPLRGKVGAGAEVTILDDEPLDYVEAPLTTTVNTNALEVSGDSMYPAYEDRTLLYYSQNRTDPASMLNKRCIAKLGDGRIFVKVLRPGSTSGTWNLESLNPAFPVMIDQVVEWVAEIDWVKPR